MKKLDELNKRLLVVLGLTPETAQTVMDRITEAESESEKLRAELANSRLVSGLLLEDPETHEVLRIIEEPKDTGDGGFMLIVANKAGERKWRHTIRTEEI